MQVAKVGFPRWFAWAFFSPGGRIKRLPYALSSFCLYLLLIPYIPVAAQIMALYILPPPGGARPDLEYVRSLAMSASIMPLLLPVCYVRLCLDFKRLRSIGAPLVIALPFAALLLFSPLIPPDFGEMNSMTILACLAILSVIPAREDRLSPLERKYRTWQAVATGDGTPRRLSGKEILSWRIVRQGPAGEE